MRAKPLFTFCLAILAFAAFALILTPEILTGGFVWDERFGEYIPWRVESGRLLAAGEFPFFTDRSLGGTPLLGLSYAGVLYPPNWLYAIFPPQLANYLAVFHTILGAAGMALYLRSRRMTPFAAFAGGVFYVSSTFFMMRGAHLSMREACLVAPWVVWLARRSILAPGPRRCGLFASALALQIAVGYVQMVVMTILWIAVEWASYVRLSKRFARRTIWLGAGVLLGVALMGVQILVSTNLLRETTRVAMTPEIWLDTAFPPCLMILFFAPRALGAPTEVWKGDFWANEQWSTLTSAAWALSLAALVLSLTKGRGARGIRTTRRFAVAYVVGIALALALASGAHFGPNRWLFYVPPFSMFRVSARWLFPVLAFVSVLAALGIHLLLTLPWWKRLAAFAGCWLVWGIVCVSAFLTTNPEFKTLGEGWRRLPGFLFGSGLEGIGPVSAFLANLGVPAMGGFMDRRELHFILALAIGATLAGARRFPIFAAAVWLSLVSLDTWVLSQHGCLESGRHDDVIEYAKHPLLSDYPRDEIGRLYSPMEKGANGLCALPNTHLFLGLSALGSYCPLVNADFEKTAFMGQSGVCFREGEVFRNPSALEMFGVTHILLDERLLTPAWAEACTAGLGRVFEIAHRKNGLCLLKLKRTPPRFDLAPRWRPYRDIAEAVDLVWAAEPAVSQRPVLLRHPRRAFLPPADTDLPRGEAQPLELRGSYQKVRVRTPGKGVLLIRDTYWPGWRYRIEGTDGRFRNVRRANGALRYVPVPGGDVVVEMRYRPPGWNTGLLVSLSALAVWVGLLSRRRLRRPIYSVENRVAKRLE